MMLVEQAPAKLNLALHVRRRRDDGYHELETLFAFVADGDTVELSDEGAGFAVDGPFAGALAGEGDNLVTRAAARFVEAFEVQSQPYSSPARGGGPPKAVEGPPRRRRDSAEKLPALFGAAPPSSLRDATSPGGRGTSWPGRITLTKRLPVASGLGGGSADAAAILRLLARWHGVALDDARLFAVADRLGSDVPACLYGRTAIGRGRGEVLTPVAGAAGTAVLLINPGVAVATGPVFAGWDGVDRGPLDKGDLLAVARAGRNDLEPSAVRIAPVIGEVLAMLGAQPGVVLARMSGSGATCFALFEEARARGDAARTIAAARPSWWCLETVLL